MLTCRPDPFLLLPFQEPLEGSCLRKVSIAWTEHRNLKQLVEEELQFVIVASQGRKSRQEPAGRN